MALLKSKKFWLVIGGVVLEVVIAGVCAAFNIPEPITQKILGYIAGLIGLSISGHIASDVTSMVKGLQKKKE